MSMRMSSTSTNHRFNVFLSRGVLRLCILLSVSAFVVGGQEVDDDAVEKPATKPCRLYMAPSFLSDDNNVRFGLYAGVDFDANEPLPNQDVVLPFVDMLKDESQDHATHNILQYLENVGWSGSYVGADWLGNHSTLAIIPGYGVYANYHPSFFNIDFLQASALLRDHEGITLPGEAHPSRGAISPYSNMTAVATQFIPAGMELFINHGDSYIGGDNDPVHKNDAYFESLTRSEYEDADKVVQAIVDFLDEFKDELQATDDLEDETLDFLLDIVLGATAGKRANLIRSLIPAHPKKIRRVLEMGGTFAYRHRNLIRTETWLDLHGLCVDTLQVGRSTIPEAGRGAFATRSFKKGDIVSPVPMIPILNEHVLDMYHITNQSVATGEGTNVPAVLRYDRTRPFGRQILLNYCFGHVESSFLMLPAAPMVNFVNHRSEKDGGPNAELRWSKHEYISNDNRLRDRKLGNWAYDPSYNIVMNLVATKRIKEGEEVFIDYGPYWEKAWKSYREKWEKRIFSGEHNGEWRLKAEDLNVYYKDKPFPVDIKTGENPYPHEIATACFIEASDVPDGEPRETEDGYEILEWVGPEEYEDFAGDLFFVCDLISRKESADGSYVYDVLAKIMNTKGSEVAHVKGVPHHAIRLVEKPYQHDLFAKKVFRQWLGIEDKHFPQSWRDLRE